MKLPVSRRSVLAGLAAASVLPAPAIAQADSRPVIRIAVQQNTTSNTLDPLREQSNVGARMFYSFLETLIGNDHQRNLELIPALATEWRRIDDRRVELKIRPGVKFHNGETLSVEDVAWNFSDARMFGERVPGPVRAVARTNWPNLDKVEIVDRETVRFVSASPDVTMEGRIALLGSEIVSRRDYESAPDWDAWSRNPAGTGPYRLKEFRADRHVILEAFDEYWGGRPPIREIRFEIVPEVASRAAGLASGQYDFICDMPPDQIPVIERSARHEAVGVPLTNHRLIVFDKNHPTLQSPQVRRAMALAIDRQLIVDSLWSGRTRVPRSLQWEYYGEMFLADWPIPSMDQMQARQLVRASGYRGEPIPFRVLNNYYANEVATAQVLVEMWRAVGLNVQIEMKENWTQIFERANRGVRNWSNSAAFGDPVASIVRQHGPRGQQQREGEWTNAEFNTLSERLESSADRAERKQVFRRLLTIWEAEDPAGTVLHQNIIFYGKRRDISWKPSALQYMDFRGRNFRIGSA